MKKIIFTVLILASVLIQAKAQSAFTSVPVGISLEAAGGGSIAHPTAGTWIFTGTQDEANAIAALTTQPSESFGVTYRPKAVGNEE